MSTPTIEERVSRVERDLAALDEGAKRNVNRIDTTVIPRLRKEIAALDKRLSQLERQVNELRRGSKNKSGVSR